MPSNSKNKIPLQSSKSRLPGHLVPKQARREEIHRIKKLLREEKLHTVCESARCPNIGECFKKGTATFMILGDVCTRNCSFCAVKKGVPLPPNEIEIEGILRAVGKLNIKHVVITSVTRDDLADGGASQFVKVIEALRANFGRITIEVLIPDFGGNSHALESVLKAKPDVLNHNIETVKRLYLLVRPKADYQLSLNIIKHSHASGLLTKSGLMLGMGEKQEEVLETMQDLRNVGCEILTLGQYLAPTKSHHPVARYLEPQEYNFLRDEGIKMGFKAVFAGPLVRSSYLAERIFLPPQS